MRTLQLYEPVRRQCLGNIVARSTGVGCADAVRAASSFALEQSPLACTLTLVMSNASSVSGIFPATVLALAAQRLRYSCNCRGSQSS